MRLIQLVIPSSSCLFSAYHQVNDKKSVITIVMVRHAHHDVLRKPIALSLIPFGSDSTLMMPVHVSAGFIQGHYVEISRCQRHLLKVVRLCHKDTACQRHAKRARGTPYCHLKLFTLSSKAGEFRCSCLKVERYQVGIGRTSGTPGMTVRTVTSDRAFLWNAQVSY